MLEDIDHARIAADRTVVKVSVERFVGLDPDSAIDTLAVEEPLEIQLAHGPADARQVKSISVTMRTPGHDFELAAGFLLSEGVIRDPADLVRIEYVAADSAPVERRHPDRPQKSATILPYQPARNIVRVELSPDVTVNQATLERNFYTTSSCGICGKASLLALRSVCPPRAVNRFNVFAETLYLLPSRLRNSQEVFQRTGGLHAAGLCTSSGQMLSSREDVGRHNAVDKLLGAELLSDGVPLRNRLLMLSGRASFELLQKALMGGIPMVVSVGAPSSLAVRVAREFDITLVGFLRVDHFNVYHGANRISGRSTSESVYETANQG
jgi:FdhD protein